MKLVVLSCDKYELCWKPFFTLLEKYYPHHPDVVLITESKKCPYCETINVNSNVWTIRFREGLKQIEDKEVLIMLDDFFIRQPVDEKRINNLKFDDNIACYNFELEYREPERKFSPGWDVQKNYQIYLNSCQPSVWNREILMDRLYCVKNPQEWETTVVNVPQLHLINTGDFIIDIGYRHQDLSIGWGITRGKLSQECYEFLKKEGLVDEIINYYELF